MQAAITGHKEGPRVTHLVGDEGYPCCPENHNHLLLSTAVQSKSTSGHLIKHRYLGQIFLNCTCECHNHLPFSTITTAEQRPEITVSYEDPTQGFDCCPEVHNFVRIRYIHRVYLPNQSFDHHVEKRLPMNCGCTCHFS